MSKKVRKFEESKRFQKGHLHNGWVTMQTERRAELQKSQKRETHCTKKTVFRQKVNPLETLLEENHVIKEEKHLKITCKNAK